MSIKRVSKLVNGFLRSARISRLYAWMRMVLKRNFAAGIKHQVQIKTAFEGIFFELCYREVLSTERLRLTTRVIPIEAMTILASHMERKGSMTPRSAIFSPEIMSIQ